MKKQFQTNSISVVAEIEWWRHFILGKMGMLLGEIFTFVMFGGRTRLRAKRAEGCLWTQIKVVAPGRTQPSCLSLPSITHGFSYIQPIAGVLVRQLSK